jgi:hypothetical protein
MLTAQHVPHVTASAGVAAVCQRTLAVLWNAWRHSCASCDAVLHWLHRVMSAWSPGDVCCWCCT